MTPVFLQNLSPARFLRTSFRLCLHPEAFFSEMSATDDILNAWGFLITSCLLAGLFAMIFFAGMDLSIAAAYFLNGMWMPLMLAAILYCVGKLICKDAPVFRALFKITAFANITYLIAWVPAVSWLTGLWRFYLIGVGLVQLCGVSRNRAVLWVLLTAGILLAIILTTLRFNS